MIPGFVAAIAFMIFFAGHYIAGLAGWEVVALFVLGLLLVISELALHPGTIIPGVTGVMLMLGSLLWAMIDRYPDEPWIPTPGMLRLPLWNLGIAVIVGIISIVVLARFLPRTSLYHRFVLGASNPSGPSFSTTAVTSPSRLTVGEAGIARSMLRPSGNAEFNGIHVDVVTQGEFVPAQSKIRVLAIEGSRIIVEEIS
jgi:membrane-bound serine protease (ClpP class)